MLPVVPLQAVLQIQQKTSHLHLCDICLKMWGKTGRHEWLSTPIVSISWLSDRQEVSQTLHMKWKHLRALLSALGFIKQCFHLNSECFGSHEQALCVSVLKLQKVNNKLLNSNRNKLSNILWEELKYIYILCSQELL